MSNSNGYSIEHIDPEIGRLVCGLDTSVNKLLLDWDINRKKNNRFVPYRIDPRIPVHQEPGDWGFFLINGEWKLCKFMGKEWWEESERVGHNHSTDAQSSRGKVGGAKGKGRTLTEIHKRKIGESKVGKSRPRWIIEACTAEANKKWYDPDHPELGTTNAGNLVRMQMRRGLPYGPENRVKLKK